MTSFALAHVAVSPALQLGPLASALLPADWWATAPSTQLVACLPSLAGGWCEYFSPTQFPHHPHTDILHNVTAADAARILTHASSRVQEVLLDPAGAAALWRAVTTCAALPSPDREVQQARNALAASVVRHAVVADDAALLQLLTGVACVADGVALEDCAVGLPMALVALAAQAPATVECVLAAAPDPQSRLLRSGLQLAGVLEPSSDNDAPSDCDAPRGALVVVQAAALTDGCHPVPTWPALLLRRVEGLSTVRCDVYDVCLRSDNTDFLDHRRALQQLQSRWCAACWVCCGGCRALPGWSWCGRVLRLLGCRGCCRGRWCSWWAAQSGRCAMDQGSGGSSVACSVQARQWLWLHTR